MTRHTRLHTEAGCRFISLTPRFCVWYIQRCGYFFKRTS
nr:MAG TPA: hypothetical protein [Caudoviricetes sp.]